MIATVNIDDEKLFETLKLAISEGAIEGWGYVKVSPTTAISLIKDGESFDVFSVEGNEKLATMTKESVDEASVLLVNKFPQEFANIVTDYPLDGDMDILFQLCCFGKVIYHTLSY